MSKTKPKTSKKHPVNPQFYCDPYALWNYGPGRGYGFPAIRDDISYISALAKCGGSEAEIDALLSNFKQVKPRRSWVPALWRPNNDMPLSTIPFVMQIAQSDAVQPDNLVREISNAFSSGGNSGKKPVTPGFRLGFPIDPATMNPRASTPVPKKPNWQPDGELKSTLNKSNTLTIMAIIDDGIPFAHQNFRESGGDKSRVEFCWLQSSPFAGGVNNQSILFGREFTRNNINTLIAEHGDDEDFLYHISGATKNSQHSAAGINQRNSHGAHIIDLATGYHLQKDEMPRDDIRIIAVQLPDALTLDTAGFGKDMFILSAFHYIFNRAKLIGEMYGVPNLRLVINFSYGYTAGRLDKGAQLVSAIDELVVARRAQGQPTAVVMPAGNTFLDRLHATISESELAQNSFTLNWRLQPGDRTSSYLELWFPKNTDVSGYKIKVQDPNGNSTASISMGTGLATANDEAVKVQPIKNQQAQIIGQLSTENNNAERWRALLALAPTQPENEQLDGAVAGVWKITIMRASAAQPLAHAIHCRVHRDTELRTYKTGAQQSYLDDGAYRIYNDDGSIKQHDNDLSVVKRFGSLNTIAAGETTLCVGGYQLGEPFDDNNQSAQPAPYSAAGEVNVHEKSTAKVDCAAISERSYLQSGTLAAGTRSGSISQLSGTSTAAPLVARRLAEAFVTKSDQEITQAASTNYLTLLKGETIPPQDNQKIARMGKIKILQDG